MFPSTFLADPLDGSDPSGWSLGADGLAVQAYLAGQSADDLADVSLLVWPWTESDSARPYGDKTYYLDAVVKLLSLTRGMLGRSAASLPLMVWNAIPIGVGTNGGIQMVREATAAIAANSAQNVFIGWPQTCDSNPNNGSWNPATGVFTNPGSADFDHRDPIDLLRFGKIGAPVAARAILAATGGDTETTIPSGIPAVGGPVISHVYQAVAKTTTLILTITHDAGNDLIVPLLATTGQGFAVMDGGSVAAPGPIIAATACMRIDSTHLQTHTGYGAIECAGRTAPVLSIRLWEYFPGRCRYGQLRVRSQASGLGHRERSRQCMDIELSAGCHRPSRWPFRIRHRRRSPQRPMICGGSAAISVFTFVWTTDFHDDESDIQSTHDR